MLSDDRAGTAYGYSYNAAGQLASVSVDGVERGTYAYNGRRQLARRTVIDGATSTTTHLVQDLWGNIIAEANASGQTQKEYIYIPEAGHAGVSLPVAVVDAVASGSPVVLYIHTDHVSRPVMMTDSNQAIVWEATFTPFGQPHAITDSATHDARFPGQWFQLESGLAYNWHRHYDPTTGRYTQPDPLGFVDGPGLYAYARGNPLKYVDPDGRNPCAIFPVFCDTVIRETAKQCVRVVGALIAAMSRPRDDALDQCLQAAAGGEAAWTNFCLASRFFGPLDRTRSRR